MTAGRSWGGTAGMSGARLPGTCGRLLSSLMCRSSSPLALRLWLTPLLRRRQLGIRVAQFCQIRRARSGVQLGQQTIVQWVTLEPGDPAVRVVEIAEDDCPGRARRLAGGDHIAVADAAILLLRLDARGVDALHTIGAFFHHAACAHRDVRVAQPLQAGGLIIGVLEKIKTPDLVGAIVRAVA